jgi:hypothetical protein
MLTGKAKTCLRNRFLKASVSVDVDRLIIQQGNLDVQSAKYSMEVPLCDTLKVRLCPLKQGSALVVLP